MSNVLLHHPNNCDRQSDNELSDEEVNPYKTLHSYSLPQFQW